VGARDSRRPAKADRFLEIDLALALFVQLQVSVAPVDIDARRTGGLALSAAEKSSIAP